MLRFSRVNSRFLPRVLILASRVQFLLVACKFWLLACKFLLLACKFLLVACKRCIVIRPQSVYADSSSTERYVESNYVETKRTEQLWLIF